jgi:diguanylate cyclase
MATTTLRPITTREHGLARLDKALHHGNAVLAVVLADLDDFGTLNERHGLEAGDEVLAAWEQSLDRNLPSDAQVHRIGGDEYLAVLPGFSAENALILLGEIRAHFAAQRIGTEKLQATASVGVAAMPPHGSTAEELVRNASQALMRAKRGGRDQVAIYIEEKMVLKSNYYSRGDLDRLAKLSDATGRTEASILREALDDVLDKYRDQL